MINCAIAAQRPSHESPWLIALTPVSTSPLKPSSSSSSRDGGGGYSSASPMQQVPGCS
jgi:hypothetical protein